MIRSSSSRPAAEDSASAATRVEAIVAGPIDVVALVAEAHHPGAGAVVLFSGEVRDNNRGKRVVCLEYEAHAALASKMIGEILAEAKKKWDLKAASATHRVGKVEIGETAVAVITSSAHRKEAYDANRYIIDRIKHEAPIWKCEYFEDGTHEWGNNCACHQQTGDPAKHIYDQ